MNKKIHIIGGGTVSHLRTHLGLCAPAYGTTARILQGLFVQKAHQLDTVLHLTKMAGGSDLETNEDVADFIDRITEASLTKIVVLNAALCDFNGEINGVRGDKHGERLKTDYGRVNLTLIPAAKVVSKIREKRKDIFAVAFKATTGDSPEEQYIAGLNLLKKSSVNLVFANDTKTRLNMVITPEEAFYHRTENRYEALRGLVEMTLLRSHLTFTRSTVVAGEPVPWSSMLVSSTLRKVVNFCVRAGAYKPFRGATVGHFACKLDDTTFLTSIRKSNFNDLSQTGLVLIETDGPDSVLAYGSKPSVGGQSQRIVFEEHREYDCIVHFHCPIKDGSEVPIISQREYECGSHQCGQSTSNGLKKFGNLSAVFLANHGPNIVFNSSIDPLEVINFIEANFDLEKKTGGPVSLGSPVLSV